MGTKPGKHARDPSGEVDGDKDTPVLERSIESSSAKRNETAQGSGDAPANLKGEPDLETRRSSSEKENLHEMSSSKSSAKDAKSEKQKSKKQGQEQPVEDVMVSNQHSPVRLEQRELEPLTPLVITDNIDASISHQKPQATSTPAANGQLRSPPLSPDSGTDQSDDETFSPGDHQLHSPSVSINSFSTNNSYRHSQNKLCLMHSLTGMCFPWSSSSSRQDSLDSRRSEPNFGRFYNISYLGMEKPTHVKGSSLKQQDTNKSVSGSHFHRPPNFTYSKEPPNFLKKKASGMAALASGQRRIVKVRRSSSPAELRNQEAIRMSMYPSAKPKQPNEPDKIERDDWPAPASPAAILPEILRQRRRSRGEKDDDEDDEDEVQDDPKFKRELEEISKIKDESGIGLVIYKELDKMKAKPHQPLDPWKASRAPSAKFEPRYRTRFQSPMFASPSRFLDRPRYAWDDSDIRTYRSASTLANLPRNYQTVF